MYQDAAGYNDVSYFTRTNTFEVLTEFYQYLKQGDKEFIMDAGSGPGTVTVEVLLPKIQQRNFRLVGIDLSKPMVDFATNNYNDPRLSFRLLDLAEKNEERLKSVFLKEELAPGFHKIFSFSVIMWTFDNEQCLRNMFTLLRPGGQILIWFVGYMGISEVWNIVFKMEKWQTYFKNENDFKFELHDSTDPKAEVVDLLQRVGFQDIICECVRKDICTDFPINGKPQISRKNLECIDRYKYKLPEHLQSEYMDDVMETVKLYQSKPQGITFDRIGVVATKPT